MPLLYIPYFDTIGTTLFWVFREYGQINGFPNHMKMQLISSHLLLDSNLFFDHIIQYNWDLVSGKVIKQVEILHQM